MRDLHIATAQLPHQFHVVIAGDGERVPRLHHAHHDSQGIGDAWASIDKIS